MDPTAIFSFARVKSPPVLMFSSQVAPPVLPAPHHSLQVSPWCQPDGCDLPRYLDPLHALLVHYCSMALIDCPMHWFINFTIRLIQFGPILLFWLAADDIGGVPRDRDIWRERSPGRAGDRETRDRPFAKPCAAWHIYQVCSLIC